MTSSSDELDRVMRRQVGRGAAIGLGSSLLAVAVFVVLVVGAGPSVPGVALLLAMVVMSAVSVDSVTRLPRPAPRVVDDQVVLPGTRVGALVMVVFGLLLTVAAVGALADPGVLEQRRAGVLPLAAAAGVGVALFGLVLMWRPGALVVGPTRVVTSRSGPTGRRTAVDWDVVEMIGIPAQVSGQALRFLPVAVQGPDATVRVDTSKIRPTVWVLLEWLEHYRLHPEDRHELAGRAALERLATLEAELSTGDRWPRWFAPPRG